MPPPWRVRTCGCRWRGAVGCFWVALVRTSEFVAAYSWTAESCSLHGCQGLGYTGHHFWTRRVPWMHWSWFFYWILEAHRSVWFHIAGSWSYTIRWCLLICWLQEYFMGFMLETLPDVSYEAISKAYEEVGQQKGCHSLFNSKREASQLISVPNICRSLMHGKATKDPIGVGQVWIRGRNVHRCCRVFESWPILWNPTLWHFQGPEVIGANWARDDTSLWPVIKGYPGRALHWKASQRCGGCSSGAAQLISSLYSAITPYNTVLYYTMLYYTILCYTLLYYTLLYRLYPYFSMCSLWPFNPLQWLGACFVVASQYQVSWSTSEVWLCLHGRGSSWWGTARRGRKRKGKGGEGGFAHIWASFLHQPASRARYLRLQCPGHHLQRCPRNQHHRQLHLCRHRCRNFNLNRWLKRRQLRRSKLGRTDNRSLTNQELAMMLSPVQPWAINRTDVYFMGTL